MKKCKIGGIYLYDEMVLKYISNGKNGKEFQVLMSPSGKMFKQGDVFSMTIVSVTSEFFDHEIVDTIGKLFQKERPTFTEL